KEHVHKARDLVVRKGIRKLLDEDLVAIQRSVLVDAALKQRSSRTWIDNRGAQPAKIANRALCDVDAFGIGIDIAERAIGDLRRLGATIVDPGPGGALFQSCINKYTPLYRNKVFIEQFPNSFSDDKISRLVDMFF